MTTVSWFYDKNVPLHPVPLATHSTYYGSSSLASSSSHDLTLNQYRGNSLLQNHKMISGVSKSNTIIYDNDKPTLGIMQAREAMDSRFVQLQPKETVPNVNVLKSKYTLQGASNMNTRPTALI